MSQEKTHFGFQTVEESEKAGKVAQVFHSVASRYDVMNDLMSAGLHRVWKSFTIGRAAIRPGMKVLDIAGGTGDLARAFAQIAGTSSYRASWRVRRAPPGDSDRHSGPQVLVPTESGPDLKCHLT